MDIMKSNGRKKEWIKGVREVAVKCAASKKAETVLRSIRLLNPKQKGGEER